MWNSLAPFGAIVAVHSFLCFMYSSRLPDSVYIQFDLSGNPKLEISKSNAILGTMLLSFVMNLVFYIRRKNWSHRVIGYLTGMFYAVLIYLVFNFNAHYAEGKKTFEMGFMWVVLVAYLSSLGVLILLNNNEPLYPWQGKAPGEQSSIPASPITSPRSATSDTEGSSESKTKSKKKGAKAAAAHESDVDKTEVSKSEISAIEMSTLSDSGPSSARKKSSKETKASTTKSKSAEKTNSKKSVEVDETPVRRSGKEKAEPTSTTKGAKPKKGMKK